MKIRKYTSYLLSVVTLITMLFSFRPVSVLADEGQKTEPEVSIEEIQSEIDEKTDIEGETISAEEISKLIEELSQEADQFEKDLAKYNQAILFLDMLLRDEGSFELVDKDLPLTNPVYEAGTLRWEAPAVTDKVYLVYVIYGYTDFQGTTIKVQDDLLLPEFSNGCWTCDFHEVTDSIGSLNLGVLDYKVISLERGEKIGYDLSYSGAAMVHLVMPPVYGTKDANGEIGEEGGKIELDHYVYFDGDPVNVLVEENEGYKLTLLAHKKGTSTSFTLDSTDDPFYWITGEFTKMQKVTLNAGGESEAASVMNRFKHQAPWDPMAEYDGGSLVTFYVPSGMETETFINKYLAPTTIDFVANTRYIGLGAQPLDAYHSKEEVDAGIANLPKTLTQDMSCYLLWARPVTSVNISLKMPANGTKITSRTAEDGTVTYNVPPFCTIDGEACFSDGTTANWSDASLQPFNGTLGKDTCYLATVITPKFGYYFAESSAAAVLMNGSTAAMVLPIFNEMLVLHTVSAAAN